MTHMRTTLIGAGLSRPDAVDKVRGDAKYVDDLAFPGMLHGWVVRSPLPHAKVMHVDLASAFSHPDVSCLVTHEDVPGKNVVHVIYDDQPALACDVVRYVGEPVALIAATSRKVAKQAAEGMKITYEELPVVSDPVEALRSDSPVIVSLEAAAEGGGNLFNEMVLHKGDADAGFAQADVIIEGDYETGYQEHAYIETQGAIAVPEEGGGMAIYASMQCPFYVQRAVSVVLGLPMSKIRVIQATTGGAFGGKEDVPSQICSLAALMAWKTRRPVKLVLDRGEDVLTTSKRHPSRVHYRTGAMFDGTITAIDVDVILNAGAYQTLSSAVLWRSLCTAAGPYRIPNVRVNAKSVATNTVPNGAFRGFGSPQVIFPHEAQLDRLAEALNLDRANIRRRNVLVEGDRSSTEQLLDSSVGMADSLARATEMVEWNQRLEAIAAFNEQHRDIKRGLGISCVLYGVGLGGKAPFLDKAGATMKLEADGSVAVAVGTVEMGQGLTTSLLQIAAEELGVSIERIQLAPVDTSRVPDSGPTVASRGTMMSGLAVLDAARKLRERVEEVALGNGMDRSEIRQRWDEIANLFWLNNLDPAVEGWAKTEPVSWDPQTGLGDAYPVYAYACHIAEVEVDTVTGETDVIDFVAVHDSGRILNRTLATGQVQGGVAQGIGFALMEDIPQKDGFLMVNGLTTYRLPTIRDVVLDMGVDFIEAEFSAGPFGAKGLGEVPLMAAHAAVASAVSHAVGHQATKYPLEPCTVAELLRSA
ncbi:xanthine dehydrogenase family protein molybdopterin-binding subunit [Candidatus Bipolaricaulota bacterium]|nr:xanthine dehydrogenase family protein molybdopterin-binding subunit [Candidatus Bipolaricaulota bacterium]